MQRTKEKEILFLHGGASTQFFQVPMNLLNDEDTAAYLDCGVWGTKAIKVAKLYGVQVVAALQRTRIYFNPKHYTVPADARYFHFTTNNTIEGTEMFSIPDVNVPLVADMSSDIITVNGSSTAWIDLRVHKRTSAQAVNVVIVDKRCWARYIARCRL